ncbi:hypothetical protein LJC18_00915 [Lachnospiraceae bacterium OttesenSCG-928-E19]|nr:hypothetical protein [Lachnospiraceae bacterium OttesenSCG-928-E19]
MMYKAMMIVPVALTLVACDTNKSMQNNSKLYRCVNSTVLIDELSNGRANMYVMGARAELTQSDAGYVGNDIDGAKLTVNWDNEKIVITSQKSETDSNENSSIKSERAGRVECPIVKIDSTLDLKNFRAIGHEPEWNITMGENKLKFSIMGGDEIGIGTNDFDHPVLHQGVATIKLAPDFVAQIEQRFCMDNMSGQMHAYKVTVKYNNNTYIGCGFNANDPLQALIRI